MALTPEQKKQMLEELLAAETGAAGSEPGSEPGAEMDMAPSMHSADDGMMGGEETDDMESAGGEHQMSAEDPTSKDMGGMNAQTFNERAKKDREARHRARAGYLAKGFESAAERAVGGR